MILRWFRRRRAQRTCFHHDPVLGDSHIKTRLIDLGRQKMSWCTLCDQSWFT